MMNQIKFSRDTIILILTAVIILQFILNAYFIKSIIDNDKLGLMCDFVADNYLENKELKKILDKNETIDKHISIRESIEKLLIENLLDTVSIVATDRDKKFIGYFTKDEYELRNKSIDSLSEKVYVEKDENNYYMDVDIFKGRTLYEHVHKNKREINTYDNLIIDLRNNPGGVIEESKKVSDLFIEKNKVLFYEENNNEILTYRSEVDKEINNKKIYIIIDSRTASAAEIFTLALKKNLDNVTIIGETSKGKGIINSVLEFKDGSAFMLVTAKWLSPEGENIDYIGVKADKEIINIKSKTPTEIIEIVNNYK